MEYDYQTGSQSVDMQKLSDIKVRKNLLEDTRQKTEDSYEQILPNTVAIPEESSTMWATQSPAKEIAWEKKDRKKEHEIFRNF